MNKDMKNFDNRLKKIEELVVSRNPQVFENVMFLIDGIKHQSETIEKFGMENQQLRQQIGGFNKYLNDTKSLENYKSWADEQNKKMEEAQKKAEEANDPKKLEEKLEEQKKKLAELEKDAD